MPADKMNLKGKKVFIAGHRGMVGGALLRHLSDEDCEVITVGRDAMDLRDQAAVHDWMAHTRPDMVFLAAAKVGGIHANDTYPADFLYDNLMIEANLIHAAFRAEVEKLIFLGSSCIYPKFAEQPIREDSLLTGALEPTNEWYAIAKIAGIKLCQAYHRQHGCNFISAMPTNLYGPGDNYHPENSHVVPALIRRFSEAKRDGLEEVVVWGTGGPLREFMHVDDCADALVFLMQNYDDPEPINIGADEEMSIKELAHLVADSLGFEGALTFDPSKPDGTPRKRMDPARLRALGWAPSRTLKGFLDQGKFVGLSDPIFVS